MRFGWVTFLPHGLDSLYNHPRRVTFFIENKVYILQKDLPATKAGTRFIKNVSLGMCAYDAEDKSICWLGEQVENTPEWFSPETKTGSFEDQKSAILNILQGMTVGEAKFLLSKVASNLEFIGKV
jgi:hypothetical protein